MKNFKKILTFITWVCLALLGIKPAIATTTTPKTSQAEELNQTSSLNNNNQTLLAQRCTNPKPYAKVITKSGSLNVRSAPNGKIIGSIPRGWAVVVGNKDLTGKWMRVTSHLGDPDYSSNRLLFASAESFRGGWVAVEFLKPLGKFCEKPISLLQIEKKALLEEKEILVNEDWVAIGDRIASQWKD